LRCHSPSSGSPWLARLGAPSLLPLSRCCRGEEATGGLPPPLPKLGPRENDGADGGAAAAAAASSTSSSSSASTTAPSEALRTSVTSPAGAACGRKVWV